MKRPKISVVMSVFNGEKYLEEAVESVLNQTFNNFEFIIVNDNSNDNSLELLNNYMDPRIEIINNRVNLGLTKSLNKALDRAKGEYVARMDADDICMLDRFQKQVDYLDRNKDISILGGCIQYVGSKNEILKMPVTHSEIKCQQLFENVMAHPTIMMRQADMKKYSLKYDEHFLKTQDYDLWTRAIKVLNFANLTDVILKYRIHDNQITITQNNTQSKFANEIIKRQLVELSVNLNDKDLNIYLDVLENGATDIIQFTKFEEVLFKIIQINKEKQIYNEKILYKAASKIFVKSCYKALSKRNSSGRYIWRSNFNWQNSVACKTKLKIVLYSLLAYKTDEKN